jgi:arginase family enzyme
MNYPVSGGPDESQLQLVFNHLAQTGSVIAISMSSWNPELDQDGRSRSVSMKLLGEL